jgi:hypothetical protein
MSVFYEEANIRSASILTVSIERNQDTATEKKDLLRDEASQLGSRLNASIVRCSWPPHRQPLRSTLFTNGNIGLMSTDP